MSTFENTRKEFIQRHFTVVEIDLPSVSGECTISGGPGYGTPLSCDQPSNSIKTYKFTTNDAPLLPESGIYRYIKSISETPAKLQSGKGLASRSTCSITFIDFEGKDPNPFSPAVLDGLANEGTFFGKLDARNILANRDMRIKNYRVEPDGSIDLVNGSETRYYLTNTFDRSGNTQWKLNGKDELSKINIGDAVWPLPLEGFIRQDVNETTQSIPVDAAVNYIVGDVIRVGEEFMSVSSVSGIGTGSAVLTVQNRGLDIVRGQVLTKTKNEDHSSGDEVFVCEISADERIDDLLERVLIDIGVDPSLIPKADWAAEIDEWHPTTRVNTLWFESESASSVLEKILTYFLIDMWFDLVAREIKISAISVWKDSSVSLSEGNEINFESIKRNKEENLRSTRALVVYDKRFLATSESVENYKKASLFKRPELETSELFGEPKTKLFSFSSIIDKNAADLLVQRYVSRYINPSSYSWVTPERKLNFVTGDIVDLNTSATVGFDGRPSGATRAQITAVTPKYNDEGREYSVNALVYDPVFADDSEIVISGNVSEINLFIQYAGAPSQPVTLTFVFDGAVAGSSNQATPAIKAGNFPVGSKLIIILANGADLKSKGGDGGNGGGGTYDEEAEKWFLFPSPTNGKNGGIVFDADGVDCDIYFSGATPSSSYPVADGIIFAPNGGDGGFDPSLSSPPSSGDNIGGDGGNGGNGRSVGNKGAGGIVDAAGEDSENGNDGVDGLESGVNIDFGLLGLNNNAVGGLPGAGIVDNGGTVTLFGETSVNYVNGVGDH